MQRLEATESIDDPLEPYRTVDRVPRPERPWLMANMVAGLDGSAASGGRVGHLSGPTDRKLFLQMRALADVVLVGAATVRAENYGPVNLNDDLAEARVRDGRPRVPRIAVVTGSLDLDPDAPLFQHRDDTDQPLVFTSAGHETAHVARLREVAEVHELGEGRLDLGRVLASLRADGAEVVLNEGGPSLLGELVADDLLDELCLTMSPRSGGDPLPIMVNPPGVVPREFALRHVLAEDSTLFLRYERERS